jgi:hypothetical protein
MNSFPLFGMGILGEYMGRVYDEVRQRPLSITNQAYRTESVGTSKRLIPKSQTSPWAQHGKNNFPPHESGDGETSVPENPRRRCT